MTKEAVRNTNSSCRIKSDEWEPLWTEIRTVNNSAHPHEVFEVLAQNPDWPFVPVVNDDGYPIGVIRERSLKEFAYARFGRELIQRKPLSEFIEPSLVVACDAPLEEILMGGSSNPNPDGIVIICNGVYRAVLLNAALLRLHEEHHVQTQVRLANAEKMEAIGTLAGGIAHDLNNMLMPIIGYAKLIRESVENGWSVETDMVDQIIISANRGQQTVKQILAFSRQQELSRSYIRISDTVREVISLLGHSLPSTIDIEMQLETEDDTVFACNTEMHQVLMNLCTNAYHAMRETGGHMGITLTDHKGPLLGWSLYPETSLDSVIRLSVSDEGTGIDQEKLPRIFEPFFTTKKQGDGTGMGLAIVHGILTRANGMISVETRVGKGTTFHLYFPRVTEPEKQLPVLDNSTSPQKSAPEDIPVIRVLFVDDETQIIRLAKAVFKRFNIEVRAETDSLQALQVFNDNPYDFDVLITDQMMPGMKGADLAKQVLEIRPDLSVIMCTGYADALSPEQAATLGIREYFLKPLDITQLAKLIQSWYLNDV